MSQLGSRALGPFASLGMRNLPDQDGACICIGEALTIRVTTGSGSLWPVFFALETESQPVCCFHQHFCHEARSQGLRCPCEFLFYRKFLIAHRLLSFPS